MTCAIWICCCHNAYWLELGGGGGGGCNCCNFEEGGGGGVGRLMIIGGWGIWIVSGVGMSYTPLFRLFEFDRCIGEFVDG